MGNRAILICGVVMILGVASKPSSAGVWGWFNNMGRIVGVGVSDGYHAAGSCSYRGFPPYALKPCTGGRCLNKHQADAALAPYHPHWHPGSAHVSHSIAVGCNSCQVPAAESTLQNP
jgi:hypothetical protein